jgi:hypothetical protein
VILGVGEMLGVHVRLGVKDAVEVDVGVVVGVSVAVGDCSVDVGCNSEVESSTSDSGKHETERVIKTVSRPTAPISVLLRRLMISSRS